MPRSNAVRSNIFMKQIIKTKIVRYKSGERGAGIRDVVYCRKKRNCRFCDNEQQRAKLLLTGKRRPFERLLSDCLLMQRGIVANLEQAAGSDRHVIQTPMPVPGWRCPT
jgi:hypothetical protein